MAALAWPEHPPVLELIQAEAARRKAAIHLVIDLVHVLVSVDGRVVLPRAR